MCLPLLNSVGLISGKTVKCFIFFLEVLKSESLVTNFGFRKCVITLPDDISLKTTTKLPAAAFVVNQKYLFSFQNKPKPNAGAGHKSQRLRRNVVQLEPGCSAQRVRSSCVSSPRQSSRKLQKCTVLDSCLPQSNAHLLYTPDLWLQPKITWPTNTPLGSHTGRASWDNLAILVFKAGLMGTESA